MATQPPPHPSVPITPGHLNPTSVEVVQYEVPPWWQRTLRKMMWILVVLAAIGLTSYFSQPHDATDIIDRPAAEAALKSAPKGTNVVQSVTCAKPPCAGPVRMARQNQTAERGLEHQKAAHAAKPTKWEAKVEHWFVTSPRFIWYLLWIGVAALCARWIVRYIRYRRHHAGPISVRRLAFDLAICGLLAPFALSPAVAIQVLHAPSRGAVAISTYRQAELVDLTTKTTVLDPFIDAHLSGCENGLDPADAPEHRAVMRELAAKVLATQPLNANEQALYDKCSAATSDFTRKMTSLATLLYTGTRTGPSDFLTAVVLLFRLFYIGLAAVMVFMLGLWVCGFNAMRRLVGTYAGYLASALLWLGVSDTLLSAYNWVGAVLPTIAADHAMGALSKWYLSLASMLLCGVLVVGLVLWLARRTRPIIRWFIRYAGH